ncbi:hypothetical protein [Arthrobacter sp. EPSL27]|uniref:hypothetical protein n=1 Tax=Arthrobacter sp. EPSL27 TaxID=1745378 RepID=UPI000AD7434D|nr:hypothetical protein [Arthrobacter sp. EPSL27]
MPGVELPGPELPGVPLAAGTDGDGVGPADGGPVARKTASTTPAASSNTATPAASQRRRPDMMDHMPHCGTTGHSRARAEVPGKATRGHFAPMIAPGMGAK